VHRVSLLGLTPDDVHSSYARARGERVA